MVTEHEVMVALLCIVAIVAIYFGRRLHVKTGGASVDVGDTPRPSNPAQPRAEGQGPQGTKAA
jgi:hypothetical protein